MAVHKQIMLLLMMVVMSEAGHTSTGLPPINPQWNPWDNWGACSLSCGTPSVRVRTRNCVDVTFVSYCVGLCAETESCAYVPCPEDGQWGQWVNWTPCSLTCGGSGVKYRTRSCDYPDDNGPGEDCIGGDVQSMTCSSGTSCPVDGEWSTWQIWGPCSVTCGEGGVRTRTRTCDDPAPAFGGDHCPCNDTESGSCSSDSCPVDGGWGAWCSWGHCLGTCDHCQKKRTRPCNNPTPQDGGHHCHCNCSESMECNGLICHRHNENNYAKNKKTCEITGGHVKTFTSVEGSFNYSCMYEAARLYDFEVRKNYYLSLDIFVEAMDEDDDGSMHVSKVRIVATEKYHATVTRTATFTVTASDIRDVFNEPASFTTAEDIWHITDPNDLREDCVCLGYENGMVTFSVKQRRDKAACIEALTYQPYIACMDMNPGLVIFAESNKLPTPWAAVFPATLCSTLSDHWAFSGSFHSLTTDQERIMFALLDQDVTQMNADCITIVQRFHWCSNDYMKQETVEHCSMEQFHDLADCLASRCFSF